MNNNFYCRSDFIMNTKVINNKSNMIGSNCNTEIFMYNSRDMEFDIKYNSSIIFSNCFDKILSKFKIDLFKGNIMNTNILENLSQKYLDIYNELEIIYPDEERLNMINFLDVIYIKCFEDQIIDEIAYIYFIFENQSNLTLIYKVLRNLIYKYVDENKIKNEIPLINIDINTLTFNIKNMALKAKNYTLENGSRPRTQKARENFSDYISEGSNGTIENLSYYQFKIVLDILSYTLKVVSDINNNYPKLSTYEKKRNILDARQKIKCSYLPNKLKKSFNYGLSLIAIELRVRTIIGTDSPEINLYRKELAKIFNKRNESSQDNWNSKNYLINIYENISPEEYKLHNKVSMLYDKYTSKIFSDKELQLILKNMV